MMEEHALTALQVTNEPTVPKVTIFKSLDSSYEIMHILTGDFVVHLVGEKGAGAFETFAEQCRHHGPGLFIFAGHIHPKVDGGPVADSPPPPERYPSYTDHGRTKTPRGGCWCISQLTTPEQERRTKEGDVCT